MRPLIALLLVCALATAAGALDTATRSVGPVLVWNDQALADFAPDWLHVKFVEGTDVALQGGRFTTGTGADLTAVNQTLAGARTVRRTFDGDPATRRPCAISSVAARRPAAGSAPTSRSGTTCESPAAGPRSRAPSTP